MVHAAPHHRHNMRGVASNDPLESDSREADLEAQRTRTSVASDHNVTSHVQILKSTKDPSTESPGVTSMSPLKHRSDSTCARSSLHTVRRRRVGTTNVSYGAVEMGRTSGWAPGQEPGVDTSDPAPPYSHNSASGGDGIYPQKLSQQCEITCVDYSEENMSTAHLDNDNLEEFLSKPKPEWSQVRWINVNGLSWDVIRVLGNYKNLHRLAIEDLMNTRSRTKADWYNDHTFIVLPLQKLVNTGRDEDDSDSDSSGDDGDDQKKAAQNGVASDGKDDNDHNIRYMNEVQRRKHQQRHNRRRRGAIATLMRDIFQPKRRKRSKSQKEDRLNPSNTFKNASKVTAPWAPRRMRTLQRWHSGPNQDRIAYMERSSALSQKGLAVSMEQVSIFLCSDNTVISFFEYSAQDVEIPIVRRLQTPGTILLESCDPSMLVESILDAIIDLAIIVTTAYQDTLGDLELEVLTDPAIHESKMIYVLTSEIAVLRNAIAPVVQLVGALKDHKSDVPANVAQAMIPMYSSEAGGQPSARPTMNSHKSFNVPSGVTISPLTIMYLGDVEDHALLIQDSYDQMRRSADNLVDLIFNTVSAFQNESMKQLTLVTCFFLPLSFMTGYFGMNFNTFDAVKNNSDNYFWYIAAPVSVAVLLLLLRDSIYRWFGKIANKTLIARSRKRRLESWERQ